MGFKNTRSFRNGLAPPFCEICGYKIFVTRHRIKPGRRGGKYILGNVITLCPNHHAEAELEMFSQWELFQIVQKRIKLQQMELGNQNGYS